MTSSTSFAQSARVLRTQPVFALTIVVVLGLAIGAATLLFSMVNALLLRPLPFSQPDELAVVWQNQLPANPKDDMSIPDFFAIAAQQKSFSRLAAYRFWRWSMNASGHDPEQVLGGQVTHDFFAVLGVTPALGRTFLPEEDRPGGQKTLLLDHQFWRDRFGGDPAVVGQTIKLDDVPYTVIGVLPASFRSPTGQGEVCWLALQGDPVGAPRQIRWLRGYGRLRAGVALAQANTELAQIMRRLEREHPEDSQGRGAYAVALLDERVGGVRTAMLVLFAAVGAALLIAVINVAGLLLARGVERQREVAIRLALGTDRSRLVALYLTETLLLVLLGGALGLFLAYLGVRALPAFAPDNLPRLEEISVDLRVALFALAVALLIGLLTGLAPALKAFRVQPQIALREGGRAATGGGRKQAFRKALVITEVALSLAMLTAAGLLVRSYWKLQQVDLGFRPDHLLTLELTLPATRYPPGEKYPAWPALATFEQRLFERLRGLPGVDEVSVAVNHPGRKGWSIPVTFDARPAPPPGQEDQIGVNAVSPDYFAASGIPLLRGRLFLPAEDRADGPPVVVLTRATADRFLVGDPVGQRLTFWGTSREVVGVVGDLRYMQAPDDVSPALYVPFLQAPIPWLNVVLRTKAEPQTLIQAVQKEIWSIDPELAIFGVGTLPEVISDALAKPRFNMTLLALFAAYAMVLTMVGIYSLMAHSVAQRTAEIGIRIALGSGRSGIFRTVVGEGTKLVLAGLVLGIALAYGVTRYLGSLLYAVHATDLLVFLAVPSLLALAGLLPCLVPYWRSTRVNPVVAIKTQ